eukprot:CAMPEP_0197871564 /NCGR_PEP_ID=MMETSP1439-20131203/1925_1 /TAXON_ID=66791 /ORGANISM="Gonyaulax spinifera, Strain CCMP409" /LENGTH=47 /DNA_ID= /DNA_START= /DNA_END= /DNA_ORIENTATION=
MSRHQRSITSEHMSLMRAFIVEIFAMSLKLLILKTLSRLGLEAQLCM